MNIIGVFRWWVLLWNKEKSIELLKSYVYAWREEVVGNSINRNNLVTLEFLHHKWVGFVQFMHQYKDYENHMLLLGQFTVTYWKGQS